MNSPVSEIQPYSLGKTEILEENPNQNPTQIRSSTRPGGQVGLQAPEPGSDPERKGQGGQRIFALKRICIRNLEPYPI